MTGRTKFKVGDKVKLLPKSDWCKEAKEDALKPGQIIAVFALSYDVTVKDSKAPMGFWHVNAVDIELIPKENEQLLLFELT